MGFLENLDQRDKESSEEYFYRITRLVNFGILHHWDMEGQAKYNLRVPVWENYLLYLAQYVVPRIYAMYKFSDYHRAVELGVGLCSQ